MKLFRVTQFLLVMFALTMVFLAFSSAQAHGDKITNHYYYTTGSETPPDPNTSPPNFTGLSEADQTAIRGNAIAMCLSGAQFDFASGWQGSAAGSWWKNEQAICGTFAKRIDDILFTGGVGCDTGFGDCGGVISGNWHF